MSAEAILVVGLVLGAFGVTQIEPIQQWWARRTTHWSEKHLT